MLLTLFVVILLAWAAGVLAERLGYPPVLGELAAGIVFGPPILGWVGPSDALAVLATVGVVFLMMLVGLKADPQDVARQAPSALLPALAGLLIPMGLGYGVIVGLAGGTPEQGLLVGVILAVTALATVSRVLFELDILETDIGQRLLCVSLLEVILVLVVFAVVNGAVGGTGEPLAQVLLKAGAFLTGAVLFGLYGLPLTGQLISRWGLMARPGGFTFALAVAFGYAAASSAAGLTFVPGAFLAGLFLGRKVLGLGYDMTVSSLRDTGLGLLTPVFFFTAGFAADLSVLVQQPLFIIAVVAAGFGGKVLAGMIGLLPSRASWREGVVLGLGMNGRGGIDVILAGATLSTGLITTDMFTALVLTTFLTTLPVPILLGWGQRWLAGHAPEAAAAVTEAPGGPVLEASGEATGSPA